MKTHFCSSCILAALLTLFLCLIGYPSSGQLTFTGVQACEYDSNNPFLNYRLDVEFTKGSDTMVIQGYFAADGESAHTSSKCGDKWRVNYNLEMGTWNYTVRFSQGANVAINGHSTDTLYPHGETGTLTVDFSPKLNYIGERYRQWNSGEYFLKFGTDSPETFLACSDFDGTYHQSGQNQTLLGYENHVQDWEEGDPIWQGRGKGIIGAINYLASQGQNAYSCVVMNINGDGRNCWPFTAHDTLDRYDVSKLDQWRIVLEHASSLGMHFQIKFSEMENHTLLSNSQRELMTRELVARFGHLSALTWNLGEEFLFTGFGDQLTLRVGYLREYDPYEHLIVFHNLTVLATIFNNETVRDLIDGASLQIGQLVWTDSIVSEIRGFMQDSTFVISNDEQGPSDYGVPADGDNLPQTQQQVRRLNQYPAIFGGAEGWESFFGYDTSCDDLTCDDFRSRENVWRTNRGIEGVVREIAFWNSSPLQNLVDTGYCFGNSEEYLIYSYSPVNFTPLDSGEYTVRYYDVLDDSWSMEESFNGTLDPNIEEWVAVVKKDDILSQSILEFEVRNHDCDALIILTVTSEAVLEESQDFSSWERNGLYEDATLFIDPSPSRYYRLTCGGESRMVVFQPCEYYRLEENILKVLKDCQISIYLTDGREILSKRAFAGIRIPLPSGTYVVSINNLKGEIIFIK